MFQATRICLHQGICRRLSTTVTSAARCPWSTQLTLAATSTAIHRPYPTACLHTQQRLYEDKATATDSGGGDSHEASAESRQTPETEGKSVDDVLADLGLGQSSGSLNIPSGHSGDTLVFNGVPFDKIPIAHIKVTTNNTIISLTDHNGACLKTVSGGTEGFKNARKGTTVAGQTVGSAAAKVALGRGIKQVRVMVKGIGPGRQTSIKGLELGGLEIISITDRTGVPMNGDKPRKAKRR